MNITEDYVSFEVAKRLKEKGFDKFIVYGWDEQIFDKENPRYFSLNFDNKEHWISCPTHQMAMKWLREVHNIHIGITRGYDKYFVEIVKMHPFKEFDIKDDDFDNYEEAVEVALKYSLENLI